MHEDIEALRLFLDDLSAEAWTLLDFTKPDHMRLIKRIDRAWLYVKAVTDQARKGGT